MLKKLVAVAILVSTTLPGVIAQNLYRYTVDIRNIQDDKLNVELIPPKIKTPEAIFHLPKIIPGTYNNADYGKFVEDVKAFDKSGKALPVKKIDDNSWQIKNAVNVARITYKVNDTYDSELNHEVYDMSGTNIEAGKNVVLNPFGFFGYFDDMTKLPYEIRVNKPDNFYASTPLVATKSDKTSDVFELIDADHLYDSPIMYSVPDTTTVKLGNTDVLISVYSPHQKVTSKAVAELLEDLLFAIKDYLGGKLPVDKYAFIFYFNGEQPPLKKTGALEHNYSSFYALPEIPFETIAPTLLDISSHEFFHIVTPLTISSKEVKDFNFNKPVLSKHLWLYEGSTEYDAHHVLVVEGLNSPEEFLEKLSEKIFTSKTQYNDQLPFTELSKYSADKYKEEYTNVYQKGALISACLDLYLLQLSSGAYTLRNLKHDLSIKFGKDKYFNDDELFDEIAALTFPEVREFFKKYVESPNTIPYEEYFNIVGVNLDSKPVPSLGNVQFAVTPEGKYAVADTHSLNEFGKKLGYQTGDELVSLNGNTIDVKTAGEVFNEFKAKAKEGETVEMVVLRKNNNGEKVSTTLTAPVFMLKQFNLAFNPNPSPEQLKLRNTWLGKKGEEEQDDASVEAQPADVASIDAIVSAMYNVISGPAGERNWNRFRSLFYPGAKMAAIAQDQQGQQVFHKFSPEEYVKMNDPYFKQFDFNEKELHRTTNAFGNIGQVFSSYEYTLKMPQQTVTQRGINSIGLVRDKGRWWITSLTWDDEKPTNPLPAEYSGQPKPTPTTGKTKKKK